MVFLCWPIATYGAWHFGDEQQHAAAEDNNELRDSDFDPAKDVGIASSAFASLRRRAM